MITTALLITMFDEHDLVAESIKQMRSVFPASVIIVVHSNDNSTSHALQYIKGSVDRYILLPNLALNPSIARSTLPSHCITRNLSNAFTALYSLDEEFDCITIITGDTLIEEATSIERRYRDMQQSGWIAMVSQAIGQSFHGVNSDGTCCIEERYQETDTTDFACCLFFLDGHYAKPNRMFANIEITNPYTSEQCLGDEMCVHMRGDFHKRVGILNNASPHAAYSYGDGIRYHARNNRPGR